MRPRIAVLYAPGTNCHEETVFAIQRAGGDAEVAVLRELVTGEDRLDNYQGLVIPGGFSFGNHIAGGRVLGVYLVSRLREQLQSFIESRKPILGICNGFQVLMESGALPSGRVGSRVAALTLNDSAKFESRWVSLVAKDTGSFWTEGLAGRTLRMPVAYAEGRLCHESDTRVDAAFLYADSRGMPTEGYPENPAGSSRGIAGVVLPEGNVLGMMPHPERAIMPECGSSDGLVLFENMVRYCALM